MKPRKPKKPATTRVTAPLITAAYDALFARAERSGNSLGKELADAATPVLLHKTPKPRTRTGVTIRKGTTI